MALSGRRYRRRKKEALFVEGYFIDHANVLTPGVNETDETFHMFGKDSPDLDKQVNFGTLTIGILDKFANNELLDLLTEQDPDASGPREYNVNVLQSADVWANVKDEINSRYIRSWMIKSWSPGLPVPSGNPEAKAVFTIAGNGELPRLFEGVWIQAAKVASGGGATLGGDTPVEVPPSTGLYAVSIKAITDVGGDFNQEDISVSSDMVDNAGSVDFAEIEAFVTTLTLPLTHAYILYLQSGTGVYPNVQPDKLRA